MRERSSFAASSYCRALLAWALLLGGPAAWANPVNLTYLEGQLPVAPDAIATLGPSLFGDQVNLFNGALEFEHTDTSLPGNNALGVALVRRHTAGRSYQVRGQFGDWDLDAPRIGGSFATTPGWVTQSGGTNRCSGWSLPPVVARATSLFLSSVTPDTGLRDGGRGDAGAAPAPGKPGDGDATAAATTVGFIASDYWQGTNLQVPGHGSQEVLKRAAGNTAAPADGRAYPLVTRNLWQIGCLPSVQNAAGEGYFAISPDGVRYRFDWMASRAQVSTKKQGASLSRADFYLMATEVVDRHGNWVRYSYDSAAPLNLVRIESSDGRVITVVNAGGRAVSATDGTRTYTYAYSAQGRLTTVQQPDGSRWSFNLGPMEYPYLGDLGEGASCEHPGSFAGSTLVGSVTHPSGAVGTFTTAFRLHGRTFVDRVCNYVPLSQTLTTGAVWPRQMASQTLSSKVVTGPGLAAMTWTYDYAGGSSGWNPCTTCPDRKAVTVTDPGGVVTRHWFGIRWRVNEGQLLQLDEGWNGSTALRTTVYRYRTSAGQAYPEQFGTTLLKNSDDLATRNRPQDRRVVTQQGATFTWEAAAGATGLDGFARTRQVSMASSLGHAKSETTAYADHTGAWVLGQVASVTDHLGGVSQASTYDAVTALPTSRRRFGLLLQTYAYHADGTLHRSIDPLGRATTWINYKRGLAQNVVHRDGAQESATINNLGKPDRHTNAAGYATGYAYDGMGRLARIDPPAESAFQYHPLLDVFEPVAGAEVGLAAGYWRQTTSKGNARTVRYYDALWRVRLVSTYDVADTANTSKLVETRYDHEGRKTFESHPQRSLSSVDTAVAGRSWLFDGLDREVSARQDSELGLLTTTTAYLGGFQRRVTNPRGHVTTFAFQAFDQPTEEHPVALWSPETVWLTITRDPYGKPAAITRGGTYGGGAQQATRRYVYDRYQRLCKTIEPETGATVQAYDAAGNLDWRASGQALAGTGSCDDTAVPATARVGFDYDARDRLTTTTYGDGSPGIGRAYTADGLLSVIWSGSSQWSYGYNNRRLPIQETLSFAGQAYAFGWSIDAHGSVSRLSYPTGVAVQYAPNALGQPTQLSGYASSVRFHPNGALAGYTLANGVAHAVTQNLRGLPATWSDAGVMNDRLGYDANGNVSAITDAQEGLSSRAMGYDGLDRLTSASGIWGAGAYSYDALDNLRASTVGSRTAVSTVDAASNRLAQLNVGGQVYGFGYDANGNLSQVGPYTFGFDIGNRLSVAPGRASYAYDGHGRRTWVAYAGGATKLQAYSQAGKLLLSVDSLRGVTSHIHLGDKLIAEVNSQTGTRYSHTDALGSPVATTNASRQVLTRTRYEPYGLTAAGTNPTGIGFTGHVNDADTGLVYMQQRYYEPYAGRFLSVDPVTTNTKTGGHFNRYVYAENNPYLFTDPDGRQAALSGCAATPLGCAVGVAITIATAVKAIGDTGKAIQNSSDSSSSSATSSGSKGEAAAPAAPAAGAAASNVRNNNSKGKQAEDEVASDLEGAGREVDRQVRKDTPFGPRVIDIEVTDKDGNVKGGVEVKQGNSRYRQNQRSKDRWLRENGYPVDVVRKP